MSTVEAELLQDYVASGSQGAFSGIVSRHVDLVFSAAQRQVRSPQLAEEITQNVFVALARHAHRLKPGTPLVAWLYLVTRRACIDALRAEARRKAREKTAMELSDMNSRSSDWSGIEPFLDAAMETLGERDRTAILLRYFEDKNLREVGAVLGMSDDAAQKRVSRALEQLRAFFSRQGVTIGAGSIATMLSTQAVHAAPIGLGLSISGTATLSGAVAAGSAANLFVMTTLQKILLTTTVIGLGLAVYEHRMISRQEEKLTVAERELAQAHAQMRQLRDERDAASARWTAMQSEIDAASASLAREQRTGPAASPAAEAEMKAVLDRVEVLKRRMAEVPGSRARAAGVLKKEDWIKVVLDNQLQTETEVRKAVSRIEDEVKLAWANSVQAALSGFIKAHGGLLPTDSGQLAPFLPAGTDPSLLHRFKMLRSGHVGDGQGDAWLMADIGTVDDDTESLLMLGRGNMIYGDGASGIHRTVARAYAEFVRSHPGQYPTEAIQLQPYLRQPVDPRQLHDFWKQYGHMLK